MAHSKLSLPVNRVAQIGGSGYSPAAMSDTSKVLYEGKAKQVLESADPQHYILHFKNSATAFNNKKKAELEGKGVVNQKISAKIFQYLQENGIASHYVKTLNDTDMLVKKVTIIPLEVVLRNTAAGSLCKRLGIKEKQELNPTLLEFYYKKDELEDPLVTEDHIRILGLATPSDLSEIKTVAHKINGLMITFFEKIGVKLVDFKLEFGRDDRGHLLLADEISPDGCRLWDMKTMEIMDKDRFRKDLGNVIESYNEIYRRLENS